jgi:hypothetical protein
MNTFMVTLCDAEGRDQRVLVSAPSGDTPEDIHTFITDPATRGTKGESVIVNARVIGIRKLHIKRPVLGTTMPEMRKTLA